MLEWGRGNSLAGLGAAYPGGLRNRVAEQGLAGHLVRVEARRWVYGRSPSRGSDRLMSAQRARSRSVSSSGSLAEQPSGGSLGGSYLRDSLGGPPDLRRRSSSAASSHRMSTPAPSVGGGQSSSVPASPQSAGAAPAGAALAQHLANHAMLSS
ncbi:hypothetical protein N2152v2_001853 [Parachlorella kessleri]